MNKTSIEFLAQLKNNSILHRQTAKVKSCNILTRTIMSKLYDEGYILNYRLSNNFYNINKGTAALDANVQVRYIFERDFFRNLKIISTPSYKKILSYNQILRLSEKNQIFIIATSRGLKTAWECKEEKLGGFLLFMC